MCYRHRHECWMLRCPTLQEPAGLCSSLRHSHRNQHYKQALDLNPPEERTHEKRLTSSRWFITGNQGRTSSPHHLPSQIAASRTEEYRISPARRNGTSKLLQRDLRYGPCLFCLTSLTTQKRKMPYVPTLLVGALGGASLLDVARRIDLYV
jgi:hypothetical protein